MRLDKFLKVSRIVKRRTLAQEICAAGRVTVNDKVAKPATVLKVGDVLKIRLGQRELTVQVKALKEHVLKDESGSLYEMLDDRKIAS